MAAEPGMIDFDKIVPMLGHHVVNVTARRIDRRGSQSVSLEFLEKFFRRIVERARFDQTINHRPQGKAALNILQFRIEQFPRIAQPFDETAPMIGLVDEDARIAVLALIGFRHGG